MSKTKLIAPSLLSADFLHLEDEIEAVIDAGCDMLHLDIMDGHFVPNLTFGPFIVEQIKKVSKVPLDVHLMIEEPDLWIERYIEAGADYLGVHFEADVHLNRTLSRIKELKAKPCVVINPSTGPESLEYVLDIVDMVLVMSVNPGFGGQKFIESSIRKIEWLSQFREKSGLDYLIEVDGGVNLDNIGRLSKAGANVFVAGSAIFSTDDYKKTIAEMKERI
ncbi:ribulose-phosphate 3-epimerase [Hippea alviniae]|uniref:ribulose-phosphate 3-epimerase n=1 Tax=Hippea alviniae TaxID=1279027 RepID=UPI0003B450F6|nr:ribulose-phosphate 3-epimerase [Hippea alviniae]